MRLLFKVQLQADYLVRREGYRSRCQHFDHTRVVKISQYLSGYFSENSSITTILDISGT